MLGFKGIVNITKLYLLQINEEAHSKAMKKGVSVSVKFFIVAFISAAYNQFNVPSWP